MTTDNFDKLGKEGNILDRMEQAELGVQATRRRNVKSARLSNFAPTMGEVDFRAVDANGNLRMVMSGYDLFDELGVHAHLVGLDPTGDVQFYLSADDGQVYAGEGTVEIGTFGIVIKNASPSFVFEDSAGNTNTIYFNATALDALEIRNNVIGGSIKQIIQLTNATAPYVKWYEDPTEANTALFQINAGNTAATMVAVGGQGFTEAGIKLRANKDGNETVFNDTSYDIDFRVEGATDTKLLKLDAGLDAAAFGGDPESGIKLKVHGDFKTTGTSLPNILTFTQTAATLASDAFTFASSMMIIDTEAAAATDNCTTINTGPAAIGTILVVRQANSARDITFVDGAPLRLAGNCVMTTNADFLVLICLTTNVWGELSRSING